jgi:hypothetical protein
VVFDLPYEGRREGGEYIAKLIEAFLQLLVANKPKANKAGVCENEFRTHLLLETERNYINVPRINEQQTFSALLGNIYVSRDFSIMKIFKREQHPVIYLRSTIC